MKRSRDELTYGSARGGLIAPHHRVVQSSPHTAGSTISYTSSGGATLKQETILANPPSLSSNAAYSNASYASPNSMTGGNSIPLAKNIQSSVSGPIHMVHGPPMRHKVHPAITPPANSQVSVNTTPLPQSTPEGGQFQKLKVTDALNYLDQVKYKFGNQPQVYNDFLDIMKEFKSQSIDTPGVIARVSDLFKGHPELIVGFNTFLPPGYKIIVQANDQGYAFQVSVSVPSPSANVHPQPSPLISPPGKSALALLQGTASIAHNLPPSQNSMPHPPAPTMSPVAPPVPLNNSQPTYIREINNQQSHGLHHISQAHQQLTHTESGNAAPQNQPVEFNHAINYVNKIKNRFQGQPDKYKRFLEILHTYQKEQRNIKEGVIPIGPPTKQLTEAEVYSQVAKLFENQDDLLAEFGQFLPDATSHNPLGFVKAVTPDVISKKALNAKPYMTSNTQGLRDREREREVVHRDHRDRERDHRDRDREIGMNSDRERDRDKEREREREREREYHQREKERSNNMSGTKFSHSSSLKRSPSYTNSLSGQVQHQSPHLGHRSEREGPPPPKRHKPICRDVTIAEAAKYGTLNDFAFFDKVRKALKAQDVYDNFLRCLVLFNQEVISKTELIQLVGPFLGKFPDLFRWFQDFLGPPSPTECVSTAVAVRQERPQGDLAMEVDLSTCKRLGASYCALPKSQEGKKCSGRTALCREVLNDTWVSFPTWAEDSTFVTSRKTQYEEYIYRVEDERFELDVVIETNAATIRVLEGVQKKLSRMSPDEVARYRLDDNLGGASPTIHQKAVRRIYGDKAPDIIAGLKKNPTVAVPVVLRRLKAKEEEWREAQKGFNKQWREQNEKYYLKSLDHQGINFKQNDLKALRSKSMFNEIETLFDERNEQGEDAVSDNVIGPHLIFPYRNKVILDDAANLLIHHVKRQTGIQKQEKARIKHILRQFVPDLFFHPRQQLSDDEREEEEKEREIANSIDELEESNNLKDDCANNGKDSVTSKDHNDSREMKENKSTKSTNNKISSIELRELTSENTVDSKNRNNSENVNNPETKTEFYHTGHGAIKSSTQKNAEDLKTDDYKVPSHAVSECPDESYTLFICNSNWYLFLRLHATLCDRISKIYEQAEKMTFEESKNKDKRKESVAIALRLKPKSDLQVEDYYPTFLDMIKNVLDGNMDNNSYEDTLREMFGIHAYIAFTLDKVVSYAVRQLQHCVTERSALECVELLQSEQRRGGAGGTCKTAHLRMPVELSYQRKAERILHDENCFKMVIYKKICRLTIELLETESENQNSQQDGASWSTYVERLKSHSHTRKDSSSRPSSPKQDQSSLTKVKPRKALFLLRNVRCCKRFPKSSVGGKMLSSTFKATLSPQEIKSPDSGISCHKTSSPTSISDPQTDGLDSPVNKIISGMLSNEISSNDTALEDQMEIVNEDEDMTDNLRAPPERMGALDERSGYFIDDNEECLLRYGTYKMVLIFNKDNLLYRKESLRKAKETHPIVTKRLNLRFRSWLKSWTQQNVTDSQQRLSNDWFMGRGSDLVPNITRVIPNNDTRRPPYLPFNRYKVERTNS